MNGQQEVSDTRLFVKNIPPEWDEWSVFHAFKKYGVVNLVQLPPSKPGFQFRFGFVEMLNEKGAKAALAAAGRQHSLTMDNLTCPLHIEACLLHNPRKGDNIRPLGEQNRLTTDDQQQRARQPSGPRGNGSSPTNGDAVRHGQPPPRRSPVSGSEQKRFVEHSWQPKKKSPNGKRVARFDHEAIFFEPSIHRHADFRLNVATQVTIPISAVKSPSDFYAIADDSAAERRQLQENMAEHYKGAKVGLAGVQEDELVVRAIGDGTNGMSYNRMLVMKVDSGDKVQGMMVDDTGITTVSLSQLLPITTEFAVSPFLAVPCGLYGVDCGTGGWSERAKQLFLHLLAGNNGDTVLTHTSFAGLKALVRVTVSEQGQTVDCAKRLSQMGHCTYNSKDRRVYARSDIVKLRSVDKSPASKPTLGADVEEIFVAKH